MIIDQIHKITIFGKQRLYYEKQGFSCKHNEVLEIKSSDLCPNSVILVKCICDVCKLEFEIPFNRYCRCKQGFVCSGKCRMQRTSESLKAKYGISNISQLPSTKKKRIQTTQLHYGVKNISQASSIKDIKRNSSIEKYGVDNISKDSSIQEKKITTCLRNYGVAYPSLSQIIRDKQILTFQEHYGTMYTNASQVASIQDKKFLTGIRTKTYRLPSGRTVRIQGYESYGLKYLLSTGLSENDILVGNKTLEDTIGKFWFIDPINNITRRYFPDIYVTSNNTVYEVKSTYTATLDIEKILLKRDSVLARGFFFEFLVFNDKGLKVSCSL